MDDPDCYIEVSDNSLRQCDIIHDCPAIVFPESYAGESDIEVTIDHYDAIILSQSCDLLSKKIPQIIVAPIAPLSVFRKHNPKLNNNQIKQIRRGMMYRYLMLYPCPLWVGYETEELVIDFGKLFGVPRSIIENIVRITDKRIRIISPFREHIAQNFGFSFMRVALPEPV